MLKIEKSKRDWMPSRATVLRFIVVMALLALAIVPAFAQSIELDNDDINQIWTGMNVMIGALGGIIFLIIGFQLGPKLILWIARIVSGIFDGLGK